MKKLEMKSGYLGVSWYAPRGTWMIKVSHGGKQTNCGYRRCRHEAARVYNEYALKLKGPNAKLNQVAV